MVRSLLALIYCLLWSLPALAGTQGHAPLHTLAFSLEGGRPYIDALLDGRPTRLLFDLGASQVLALAASDSDSALPQADGVVGTYRKFDGSVHQSRRLVVGTLRVGTIDMADVPAVALAGEHESLLGAKFAEPYLLAIDYAHKQIRAYPSGDRPAMRAECGQNAFPIDITSGVLRTYLWTGTKLLRAALDTGANFTVVRPTALGDPPVSLKPGTQPALHQFESLQMNEEVLRSLKAAKIEFLAPDVDIVLGANFFSGRVVCIDLQSRIGGFSLGF